ncbi:hypothetical protein CH260_12705 [Rhodococcus sp. 05-2256-B2]|uniref:hypothetical protein n=1 Tax=unclassified Rhodococcus (in: high G+C Gram-positive bacteria) TaxID=192944 RepID=UPI000B9BF34F|nr:MULTISPECIES: hypothetical protein [unclassified Rhodococcus (in: high G+C Gram-positive bacteria)]OZD82912.1 hypothetical protein CH258_18210 [Rhodococcus sp. 05-2256-B4]OZD96171.1 hypothetical protein CH260_12705 [Rhodococcus sp. 05-2256-B2]OZD96593.1 hypothetical protein CH257_04865 [Rhodococcus sp. 05-2256-B3]OZD99569.1 hypothetical protein CH285_20815 [Rhodococcus sp. 05-2256-B1]
MSEHTIVTNETDMYRAAAILLHGAAGNSGGVGEVLDEIHATDVERYPETVVAMAATFESILSTIITPENRQQILERLVDHAAFFASKEIENLGS